MSKRRPEEPVLIGDPPRIVGMCEVCFEAFTPSDLEDGVTLTTDCCEQGGFCRRCRRKGHHDCE